MATVFMRYPGGRDRALTLSYDDGVQTDRRLIEIMNRGGLKGTFNINTGSFAAEGTVYPAGTVHRRMSQSEAYACYADSGMEVAVHGAHHPYWNLSPTAMTVKDIADDRVALEKMFGQVIRGAAYPFGTYNDNTVDILRLCGIAYCRTTVSTERFEFPTDWLRLPATCHHNNKRLMELAKQFVEANARGPLLFYLWGHSYEFDGNNNWEVIEEFVDFIGNRNSIWYATNIEIYDYADAYSRLQFSMAGDRVYNPSFTEVWFNYQGKIYSVKPGETVLIGD